MYIYWIEGKWRDLITCGKCFINTSTSKDLRYNGYHARVKFSDNYICELHIQVRALCRGCKQVLAHGCADPQQQVFRFPRCYLSAMLVTLLTLVIWKSACRRCRLFSFMLPSNASTHHSRKNTHWAPVDKNSSISVQTPCYLSSVPRFSGKRNSTWCSSGGRRQLLHAATTMAPWGIRAGGKGGGGEVERPIASYVRTTTAWRL